MALIGEEEAPAASIPHLHGLVSSCRGETLAIRRPGHTVHRVGMALIGIRRAPAAGIPHLHGLVKSCRGQTLAIRRPGETVHRSGMVWICIRKAFWWKEWWGRCTPTKPIDEEPRSHCSCQTCQADQHHAPGITLPLL